MNESNSSREDRPDRDNIISVDTDLTAEDVQQGGFLDDTTRAAIGTLAETTGGGTRGDAGNALGGRTGGFTGGTGVDGMDVNSTDAGRSDITGGGTASGLGATSGGGTT